MNKIALAGLAMIAALPLAPLAHADVPGLDPFVGTWKCSKVTGNTGERLVIDSNGVGVYTWPNVRDSPDGQIGDAPLSSATYVFTAVANGVATGSVSDSTDPKVATVGAPVHAKITGSSIETTVGTVDRIGLTNDDSGPCH